MRVILALSLLSALATAEASAETALEMSSLCKRAAEAKVLPDSVIELPQDGDSQRCWGAFLAMQEFSRLIWSSDDQQNILRYCPPQAVTRLQKIKVFQKYVADNPAEAHRQFGPIAITAMQKAFPCK